MSVHRRVQTTGHSKKRKVVQVDIDRTVDRRQSLSIKIARRSSLSIIYKIKNSKNLKKIDYYFKIFNLLLHHWNW